MSPSIFPRPAFLPGSIFYQFIVLVRTMNKDQLFDGFYCFAKDVTEHKYQESLEIKAELIQMVSHELRTPIHSAGRAVARSSGFKCAQREQDGFVGFAFAQRFAAPRILVVQHRTHGRGARLITRPTPEQQS